MPLNPCKIPKAITLNGVRWKVLQLPPEELKKRYEGEGHKLDTGEELYGRANVRLCEIWLDSSLGPLPLWRTFCHEVIHAVQDSSGQQIDEVIARAYEMAVSWLLNRGNWEY